MFNAIISTTLRFFDTNPSGRILNLFSKDLGTVDELLPTSILTASQYILIVAGSISVTVTVRPYFIIPIVLIGIIFIYVRKIYLKSSQDIKRMEGISKLIIYYQIVILYFDMCSSIPCFHSFIRNNARIVYNQSFESTKCPYRRIR